MEKKEIVLRELEANDIYAVSEIADMIGVDPNEIKAEGKSGKQIGLELMYKVFSKWYKAKAPVNKLLASMSGLTVAQVEKLSLTDYAKIISQLKQMEGLMTLFK